MKKIYAILLCSISFLSFQPAIHAQDSTKHGAVKQINATSAQSDNLTGKKIQQQSISSGRFEKLDTITARNTKKKTRVKQKRKHQ